MKNIFRIMLPSFILVFVFSTLASCKSTSKKKEYQTNESSEKTIVAGDETERIKKEKNKGLPEEHLKSIISNDVLYAKGTGKSKNMQFALEKATLWAKQRLTGIIETKVSLITKYFLKDSGVRNTTELLEFSEQLSKKLASNVMANSKIKERDVKAIDDNFVAYTLIELPLTNISKAIDEIVIYYKIEYSALNANRSFYKLAEELKKLRASDYIAE